MSRSRTISYAITAVLLVCAAVPWVVKCTFSPLMPEELVDEKLEHHETVTASQDEDLQENRSTESRRKVVVLGDLSNGEDETPVSSVDDSQPIATSTPVVIVVQSSAPTGSPTVTPTRVPRSG